MDWHRRRQIITSLFAAGILLLSVMAIVTVVIDRHTVEDSAELSKLRDRSETATELLVALVDIETGVRGYLIAGDPAYLEPYYRGRNTVTLLQEKVGHEIESWSAPGYSELTLGALMKQREKLMAEVIETARTEGYEAAQEQLSKSDAKLIMDRMRSILGRQLTAAAEEADAEQRHADIVTYVHSTLVVVTLTLAIAFSIVKFGLFRTEVRGRSAMEANLRRRNEERRQIGELSSSLQLSDSRIEAYGIIEVYARRIMPELSGAFYVYTASRDQLTLVAQWGRAGDENKFFDHMHPSDCWGLRQGGRHSGGTEQRADMATAPIDCRHMESAVGAYTCVPIVGRGQILGMLHLRGAALHNPETAAALDGMIERLGDQLSLSLTNIELREKLENMALRDGLTGLYNRRFLDEVLEHDLAKLKRDAKKAALLLLDVDHFKRFNDTHGHQAGDEALRRVGATLSGTVRSSDVVCRYGGEEFLVFLPDCDLAEATAKAEKIRDAIAMTSLAMDGKAISPVTASIGLAMFPDTGITRAQLVQIADRALYRAKGAGRNRVVVAEPVTSDQDNAPAAAAAK